jgi:hypothetical protein
MKIRNYFLVAAAMLFCAASISAQLASTFVSASGSDSNACTQGSPCGSFQAAYNKTAAGGSISAMTPGEFGPLTVQKSVTIDGSNMASISATTMGVGVYILNPSSSTAINVTLRGLAFYNSATQGVLGSIGVETDGALNLTIENCLFENLYNPILIDNAAPKNFLMKNSTLVNGSYGVQIINGGTASMQATLQNVTIQNMSGYAVYASVGTTEIMNSVLTQNAIAVSTGQAIALPSTISVESSMISQNGVAVCSSNSGKIRLENNDIFDNGTGVGGINANCGGQVKTNGNNRDSGNTLGNPVLPANVSATALF